MLQRVSALILISGVFFFSACTQEGAKSPGGAIVLGDSSTIVTETDSQYLRDLVLDVKPLKQTETAPHVIDTTQAQVANTDTATNTETAKTEEPKEPEAGGGPVLTVPFREATVFIQGIETKSYTKQNPKNSNGASYGLTKGKLNGKKIKVSGSDIQKISQRYQTVIVIKNSLGTLPLTSMNHLTEWKPLKGNDNVYTISGLDGKLEADRVTTATIKRAISKAARSMRMSRATEQKWLNSVKNVRSAHQKPLSVVLRSVMWKIDGRDAKGKFFQKQLRIDIPI